MKRNMLKGGSLNPSTIQALLKKSYEQRRSSFQDFQIDNTLSGGKAQVYYNPKTGQAVVVHRGSEGSKDWLVNDTGLLVGYRGKRFRHAQKIQEQAEAKYGASNVTTLGHSLGAKIAEEVGQNSKEIITLNKPTVDTKKVSDKQYDIRTGSDVVSGFSGIASSNNKTTIPSGYRDFISEHSTDVLSRLPDEPIGRGRMMGGATIEETAFLQYLTERYNQIIGSGDTMFAQRYYLKNLEDEIVKNVDSGSITLSEGFFTNITTQIDDTIVALNEDIFFDEQAYTSSESMSNASTGSIEPDFLSDSDYDSVATEGGRRAVSPISPRVFSTYTAEEIREMELVRQAREIQRAEDAEMMRWFLAIQNPADMERRPIRPRNIGAPRGGIKPATPQAVQQATHNFLLMEIEGLTALYNQITGLDEPDEVLVSRLEGLSNYIDGLIEQHGMAEMFDVLIGQIDETLLFYQMEMEGGRKTREQMTPATLARLEAQLARQTPLEPIRFDLESEADFVAQLPPYLIGKSPTEQRQFITDMVKQYYEEQERILAEMEAEMEAKGDFDYEDDGYNPFGSIGGSRMDCYSQRHDCGCDSFRDFNSLHAM